MYTYRCRILFALLFNSAKSYMLMEVVLLNVVYVEFVHTCRQARYCLYEQTKLSRGARSEIPILNCSIMGPKIHHERLLGKSLYTVYTVQCTYMCGGRLYVQRDVVVIVLLDMFKIDETKSGKCT